MKPMRIAAVAALLLLAGCTPISQPEAVLTTPSGPASGTGPPASASATPSPGPVAQRYSDMKDLLDAATAAGLDCGNYAEMVKPQTESIRCGDGPIAYVFATEGEVREWAESREWDEEWGGDDSSLHGANWAFVADMSMLLRLRNAMGGTTTPGPEEPERARYSDAEVAFLEAAGDDYYLTWGYEDDDEILTAARERCASFAEVGGTTERALSLLNYDNGDMDDFELLIAHICPKHKKALKLAKRGFTDGTYAVGDEVKAGTYRTARITDHCYWARTSDHGDIIDNEFITNAAKGARVTIRKSDGGFESSNCGGWVPVG